MPGKFASKGYRFIAWMAVVSVVFLLAWPAGTAGAGVRVTPETVRVGLMQGVPEVSFSFQGKYRLINDFNGQVIAEDDQGHLWQVKNADGLCLVLKDGEKLGAFTGPIKAKQVNIKRSILAGNGIWLQKDSLTSLAVQRAGQNVSQLPEDHSTYYVVDGSGRVVPLPRGWLNLVRLENGAASHYRGNLEIRPAAEGLTVVNELPIEQYLYGVVPAEMPSFFPVEALKAQAVASRSYTITQLGSYAAFGFDVLDNQYSQVYKGYDEEDPITTEAVDATKGLVLQYRGQPVAAFFHSSSGGCTENSEDVWKDSLPYIRSKEDPFDHNDKYYNWTVTYSADQLTATVNRQLPKFLDPEKLPHFAIITDLQELERTSTGLRVKKMLIKGLDAQGKPLCLEVYNADRVRIALGLRSALFKMRKYTKPDGTLDKVTFTGSGWGHGLGMSQWGAAGLASQGYSFQDILQYYYTGVKLVNNYGM